MKDDQKDLAETRLRIIKEDLTVLDRRAKKILEERAELILKMIRTREVIMANTEQDE